MNSLLNKILNNSTDQAQSDKIHQSIVSGYKLSGPNFIILFCACIIASIGLNVGSTAVIIGAMLISPIMGPIIAIGYSLATQNMQLLEDAAKTLSIEIIIALAGSIIFFTISPIIYPSSELIARTSPTFFDMLIAFFGGLAGIIGLTRTEKSNVIPGVAIATALMPPLCTVGYGIAHFNLKFILGASILFTINLIFIMLSTFITVKAMRLKKNPETTKRHFPKIIISIVAIFILIPTTYYTYTTIRTLNTQAKAYNFTSTEINNDMHSIESFSIDKASKTIDIIVQGTDLTEQEIAELDKLKAEYGLTNYTIQYANSADTLNNQPDYIDLIK